MNELDKHSLDQKSWSFLNLIGQTPLEFSAKTIIASASGSSPDGQALELMASTANQAIYGAWVTSALVRRGYFGYPAGGSSVLSFTNEENANVLIGANGVTQLTVSTDGTITPTVGYRSSDASQGIDTSITSANLVGKTITVKDGLITAFA